MADAVHAPLPALLTGTPVWECAATGLFAGGLSSGPPAIQALAVIGGPASVAAVVWWEISRLRALFGVTPPRLSARPANTALRTRR